MSALAVTAPVLVAIAIVIRATVGSPVLFRQVRLGRDGRPFAFVKFRTMTNAVDRSGALLPDEQRLTRFGAWLRSTSLDELPELVHVVRGKMSLVGPRPLPAHYGPRYSATQARRHEVPPGLTGWAQINGRNETSWSNRLAMDVWYVDHRSTSLDLRILARTAAVVLSRSGIRQEGYATMPEFAGGE